MARDLVELDAPDSVRGQVPSVAGVAEREALIERPGTESHWAIHVGIAPEEVAEAKSIAEIPGQLNPCIWIKQASGVGRVLNARFYRNCGREGRLQSCAEDFPRSGPNEDGDIDSDASAFRARAPASPVHRIGEIKARRGRRPGRSARPAR